MRIGTLRSCMIHFDYEHRCAEHERINVRVSIVKVISSLCLSPLPGQHSSAGRAVYIIPIVFVVSAVFRRDEMTRFDARRDFLKAAGLVAAGLSFTRGVPLGRRVSGGAARGEARLALGVPGLQLQSLHILRSARQERVAGLHYIEAYPARSSAKRRRTCRSVNRCRRMPARK